MTDLITCSWLLPVLLLIFFVAVWPRCAIDVNTEHLLTFSALAKLLPRRRQGCPTHVSTIHRWHHPGVGGVRLEAVRIGGSWMTSKEAYERFCTALTNQAEGSTSVRDAGRDEKQIEKLLDDCGI